MKKTIKFGKIAYNNPNRKTNAVEIEIELEEREVGKPVFSASGNIWNGNHTDIYCGGQCLDTIAEYIHTPLFKKIYRLWKLYHLNGLNAGTPEQTKAVDLWLSAGNKYDYAAVCDFLKSINLYEVNLCGKPYKYGHAWPYREIPEPDLSEIKSLFD